jgi:hypothetical protein
MDMAEISFSRRLGELAVLCEEGVQVCTFVRE